MNDGVSVVIPIYNVKEYLRKCVESVLAQTYKEIEVILVDDGSTDGSDEICDKLADTDARIKVVHKKNGGLVSARKVGMKEATGDFLLNIDGDDWIEQKMIELLVKDIHDNNSDVAACCFWKDGSESEELYWGKEIIAYTDKEKSRIATDWLKGELNCIEVVWNKLYKADLFRQVYEYVPDYICNGEDVIAFFNLIHHGAKISVVYDKLYHYVNRPGSVSKAVDRIARMASKELMIGFLAKLLNEKYDVPKDILDRWIIDKTMIEVSQNIAGGESFVQKFYTNKISLLRRKKVVIYGAGKVGKDLFRQLSIYDDIEICAWVDQNYQKYNYGFHKIESVDSLISLPFDVIMIAVWDKDIYLSIKKSLIEKYGICEDRVVWCDPQITWRDINGYIDSYSLV